MDGGLMVRTWIVGGLAAVLLFFGAATAVASVPQSAIDSMEEGARLYQAEEYDEAAVAFRRAYEIHPNATFLYNAARASHRAGNLPQAYRYYERALEVDGEGYGLGPDDEAKAEGYLRGLRVYYEAGNMGAGIAERYPEVEEVQWGNLGRSGIATAGVGGALAVVAGVLSWQSSARIDELRRDGAVSFAAYQEEVGSIESRQRMGQWALYGGGLLVAVGGGLVGWELLTVDEVSVGTAKLNFSNTGVSAVWEVRFE